MKVSKELVKILDTCSKESKEIEVIDDVSYRAVYLDKVEKLIQEAYAAGQNENNNLSEQNMMRLPLGKRVPIALADGSVLYLERVVLSSFQALVNEFEKEIQ